jgi:hypothetical protein
VIAAALLLALGYGKATPYRNWPPGWVEVLTAYVNPAQQVTQLRPVLARLKGPDRTKL